MTDIVERLRQWCIDWNGEPMSPGEPPRGASDGLHCDVLIDAADEIEKLRGEVAFLEDECSQVRLYSQRLADELKRLKAELAALRKAGGKVIGGAK